jgi:hypothetical protein
MGMSIIECRAGKWGVQPGFAPLSLPAPPLRINYQAAIPKKHFRMKDVMEHFLRLNACHTHCCQ